MDRDSTQDPNTSNQHQSEGTVSVPTHEQNPLLQKLTPKQFNAGVKFYEADQQLNTQDRKELSDDLGKIVTRTAVGSYFCGMLGFFGLTGYNRLVNPRKGLNVLPDPLKRGRVIHQPFLSFLIGLTTMIATNEMTGRYLFSKKIEQLKDNPNGQNQLQVWQAMDHHQASLFFLYYKRTSEDASFILKDPRSFTEKSLHEVHYRPPMAKSHKNSVLGRENEDSNFERVGPHSHWEQIRIANGFTPPDASDSNVNNDTSSNTDSNVVERPESDPKSRPVSAWDKVRQGLTKL